MIVAIFFGASLIFTLLPCESWLAFTRTIRSVASHIAMSIAILLSAAKLLLTLLALKAFLAFALAIWSAANSLTLVAAIGFVGANF
jgi:hypothetical protein